MTAAALVAPELPEAVVGVWLGGAALGVTLPTAAIVVTAVVITVGVGAAASLTAKKITEVGIKLVETHFKD